MEQVVTKNKMSYFRIVCLFFSFCLVCCLFSHKNLSLIICSLSKNSSENNSLNNNSGKRLGETGGEGRGGGQGYCWHKYGWNVERAGGINYVLRGQGGGYVSDLGD